MKKVIERVIDRLSRIKFGTEIQGNERLKPEIRITVKLQKLFGVNSSGFHLGVNPLGFHCLIGLMMLGVVLCVPNFANGTPTTNLLITDRQTDKVIEVDPITKSVVWEYSGTLSGAYESIPLTNGNIIIADAWNHRVIEVNPAKEIKWYWQPGTSTLNYPLDVKKTAQGTLLVTDGTIDEYIGIGNNKVYEITHTTGTPSIVWQSGTLNKPRETERLPGTGTPTYLITEEGSGWSTGRVMLMQRDGTIIWEKTGLEGVCDATWLVGNSILITEMYRVTKIDYPSTATSWQRQDGYFVHRESIQIENGHFLISGRDKVIEVDPLDNSIDWKYEMSNTEFYDVEVKGIINIARADYKDSQGNTMTTKFAGVIVPITPPTVNLPEITLYKMVYPGGAQQIGATLTYTLNYYNAGSGTAKNVMITDIIPDGTEYVLNSATVLTTPNATEYSHDGGLNYDSFFDLFVTHIRWSIAELPALTGGTLQFQVVIK